MKSAKEIMKEGQNIYRKVNAITKTTKFIADALLNSIATGIGGSLLHNYCTRIFIFYLA